MLLWPIIVHSCFPFVPVNCILENLLKCFAQCRRIALSKDATKLCHFPYLRTEGKLASEKQYHVYR